MGLSMATAVLLRRYAGDSFKDLGKILDIHDAAILGNGLDLQPSIRQQIGCVIHSFLVYIIC